MKILLNFSERTILKKLTFIREKTFFKKFFKQPSYFGNCFVVILNQIFNKEAWI